MSSPQANLQGVQTPASPASPPPTAGGGVTSRALVKVDLPPATKPAQFRKEAETLSCACTVAIRQLEALKNLVDETVVDNAITFADSSAETQRDSEAVAKAARIGSTPHQDRSGRSIRDVIGDKINQVAHAGDVLAEVRQNDKVKAIQDEEKKNEFIGGVSMLHNMIDDVSESYVRCQTLAAEVAVETYDGCTRDEERLYTGICEDLAALRKLKEPELAAKKEGLKNSVLEDPAKIEELSDELEAIEKMEIDVTRIHNKIKKVESGEPDEEPEPEPKSTSLWSSIKKGATSFFFRRGGGEKGETPPHAKKGEDSHVKASPGAAAVSGGGPTELFAHDCDDDGEIGDEAAEGNRKVGSKSSPQSPSSAAGEPSLEVEPQGEGGRPTKRQRTETRS